MSDPQPRTLTGPAFDRLLETLDRDSDRAADPYRLLHERLTGLLRWWGALHPEELADESLDRVARKLEQGTVIAPGSLGPYVRGVARLIFYEAGRREIDPVPLDHAPELSVAPNEQDREQALTCLDRCLEKLPPDERAAVLSYYNAGTTRKSESRRELATSTGLTLNALRIRMHRIRERLETCVRGCTRRS